MFFLGITVAFLLFLIIISLGVFTSSPQEVSSILVFNKPKVNIDMRVFDLEQFKNLKPFPGIGTLYSYIAANRANKSVTGFIVAASMDEARATLQNEGIIVSAIKEAVIGRDNPFISYYQTITVPVVLPVTAVKTTTSSTKTK